MCTAGGRVLQLGPKTSFSEGLTALGNLNLRLTDIAFGVSHALALTADGQVLSFGTNERGQLGLGHTRNVANVRALACFLVSTRNTSMWM